MSIEKATTYLKKFGKDKDIIVFDRSSATVELAAAAIGCDPAHIAKSILLLAAEGAVLVLASGIAKVDNKKYKDTFREKPKMVPFDRVEELSGHTPGGVCPFGINPEVRVYIDESLRRFDTVFPAAGSDNSVLSMSLDDLVKCSGSLGWVDVCKEPEA